MQLPDGRTATYSYDPFGRRIKKQVGTETTIFVYADEGLIGEYSETGATRKAYGWRPGGIWGTNPLFQIDSGNYYFYHNDHLGTPQIMTDAAGDIVWEATYEAFGKATVDLDSTVTNNLRFPGQYWDEETGLHYNWHRYYDPGVGRYVEVDPIGFRGGMNLFVYVQNDPLKFIDPMGLKTKIKMHYVGKGSVVVAGRIGRATAESDCFNGKKYKARYAVLGGGLSAGFDIPVTEPLEKIVNTGLSASVDDVIVTNDNIPPIYVGFIDTGGLSASFIKTWSAFKLKVDFGDKGVQQFELLPSELDGAIGLSVFKIEGVHLLRIEMTSERCCK